MIAARCVALDFSYRRHQVFNDFNIEIGAGISGLLGPNGAGKSTLMSLLATHRAAGGGLVEVLGLPTTKRSDRNVVRRQIGFLPQRYPLVGAMYVRDLIAYGAWCHGVSRRASFRKADGAIETLELERLASRRVGQLSGGQRQRVGIAATIAHSPQFLILDEPTSGLDPDVRVQLRGVLAQLANECSVLISTHLADDVALLCDRVFVIDDGQLLFAGCPSELEALVPDGDHTALGTLLERGYQEVLRRARAVDRTRSRRGR